ncbi:MAG TPA: hypothetical protein HPP83_09370, partial [Candidatus Hydrogenedentes bacterium]|nr:hypothetical protein [Candidatus Hydrogenedentota bacterium]
NDLLVSLRSAEAYRPTVWSMGAAKRRAMNWGAVLWIVVAPLGLLCVRERLRAQGGRRFALGAVLMPAALAAALVGAGRYGTTHRGEIAEAGSFDMLTAYHSLDNAVDAIVRNADSPFITGEPLLPLLENGLTNVKVEDYETTLSKGDRPGEFEIAEENGVVVVKLYDYNGNPMYIEPVQEWWRRAKNDHEWQYDHAHLKSSYPWLAAFPFHYTAETMQQQVFRELKARDARGSGGRTEYDKETLRPEKVKVLVGQLWRECRDVRRNWRAYNRQGRQKIADKLEFLTGFRFPDEEGLYTKWREWLAEYEHMHRSVWLREAFESAASEGIRRCIALELVRTSDETYLKVLLADLEVDLDEVAADPPSDQADSRLASALATSVLLAYMGREEGEAFIERFLYAFGHDETLLKRERLGVDPICALAKLDSPRATSIFLRAWGNAPGQPLFLMRAPLFYECCIKHANELAPLPVELIEDVSTHAATQDVLPYKAFLARTLGAMTSIMPPDDVHDEARMSVFLADVRAWCAKPPQA